MDQTVKFSVEEINQLLSALGKIPAEHSMNIIMFIKQTAENQLGSGDGTVPDALPAEAEEA